MAAVAQPSAVYSPALLGLQATVADSFALVMQARTGVPAKTAFDVAALLQLSADELASLLHTPPKLCAPTAKARKDSAPPPASRY